MLILSSHFNTMKNRRIKIEKWWAVYRSQLSNLIYLLDPSAWFIPIDALIQYPLHVVLPLLWPFFINVHYGGFSFSFCHKMLIFPGVLSLFFLFLLFYLWSLNVLFVFFTTTYMVMIPTSLLAPRSSIRSLILMHVSSLLDFWTQFQLGVGVGVEAFYTTNKQFWDISKVSKNSTQLWHYLHRDNVRFHRLRIQSYKMAPTSDSDHKPTCTSDKWFINQKSPWNPHWVLLIC